MIDRQTEPLYRKKGRRYVPAYSEYSNYYPDRMEVGTFRLVHAHTDGGRRYEYDVTAETAPVVAGLMIYRGAIVRAIKDGAIGRPSMDTRMFTKKQQDIIKRFRAEMAAAGGLLPEAWTVSSARDIADAAMQALRTNLNANTEARGS